MFKIRPNVIAEIYGAIEEIVYMSELNGVRASVTLLDDRFQNPRGQYRDILVLFKINGYACELQINIEEILIIKEGLGHKQYELIRKVNDDLLDAAMRNNTSDAQTALSGKADPNAPRDMYDLTPLHYAAHHNNAEIVNMLVSNTNKPANVFAQDVEGWLPIQRAILLGHVDVVSSLLGAKSIQIECKIDSNRVWHRFKSSVKSIQTECKIDSNRM